MEIKKLFKSLSKLEILLLIILIVYVIFPIDTPNILVDYVDSSLGMLVIFITTVYLFFHANIIIAVIYVLVAYELLRRSSQKKGKVVLKQYTPPILKTNIPNPNPAPSKKNVTFDNTSVLENMDSATVVVDEVIISSNDKGEYDILEIEMVKQIPLQNKYDSKKNFVQSEFQPVLQPVKSGSLFM